jgi:aryl-alcohol dehydrogenase-like predicted oxidoreductase
MYAWQFAKAQHTAEVAGWTQFTSMQNHYNLIYREEEREMIPLCLDQGVGCIPWSPLARGLLAGNRERGGAQRTVRASTDPLADELLVAHDLVLPTPPTRAPVQRRPWPTGSPIGPIRCGAGM